MEVYKKINMENLSDEFWNNRYKTNDFGWDIGDVSEPLKKYIEQLDTKELKILIPGAGNAYEAEFLFKLGFKNVFVLGIFFTAQSSISGRLRCFYVFGVSKSKPLFLQPSLNQIFRAKEKFTAPGWKFLKTDVFYRAPRLSI